MCFPNHIRTYLTQYMYTCFDLITIYVLEIILETFKINLHVEQEKYKRFLDLYKLASSTILIILVTKVNKCID